VTSDGGCPGQRAVPITEGMAGSCVWVGCQTPPSASREVHATERDGNCPGTRMPDTHSGDLLRPYAATSGTYGSEGAPRRSNASGLPTVLRVEPRPVQVLSGAGRVSYQPKDLVRTSKVGSTSMIILKSSEILTRDRVVIDVECPNKYCGAQSGNPCIGRRGSRITAHVER
jgi:hypothetical protein